MANIECPDRGDWPSFRIHELLLMLMTRMKNAGWGLAGLALLGVALVMLETTQPYYFCQDDVLACDFPPLLFSCRSVWSGATPQYNPYGFMGGPLMTQGRGATYPPLYLAYALARHVLGNEYATLDILAILHLIVGYMAVFAVARSLGMRGMIASLAGLTFALSGPVLVMGRSWFQVFAMAACCPLFALAAERLRRGSIGWRWVVGVGGLIGLFYHAGFPQLWVFGVGFFLLHVAGLLITRAIPPRRALWGLPTLLIGAGLIYPLYYQQKQLALDLGVESAYGSGVSDHLLSFLLPYPLQRDTGPNGWGSLLDFEFGGHFFYAGSLMTVLFLVALVGMLVRRAGLVPRRRGIHVLTFCALVAFVLSLGNEGYLWRLADLLPMGLRNYPFRVLPVFVLFSVFSGGVVLERLLRRCVAWRGFGLVVTVAACLLLFYHVSCARASFYSYGFRPYPSLPADLLQLLRSPEGKTSYRSIFCAAQRSADPSYPFCLPQSLSTVYELPAMTGYDPLLSRKAVFVQARSRLETKLEAALRAYGVRWVLLHRSVWMGRPYSQRTSPRLEIDIPFDPKTVHFAKVHEPKSLAGAVLVGETHAPDPLCFIAGAPSKEFPVRFGAYGIDVELDRPAEPRTVVVNFLRYRAMRAYVDGTPTPIRLDDWRRMVIDVPSGARKLEIRYQPPWKRGVAAGCLLVALGLALVPLAARLELRPRSLAQGHA